MGEQQWVPLRVLVVNTHVGLLLLTAVRALLRDTRYHAVLLQEVQSPYARLKLRRVFRRGQWDLVGVRPASRGRASSGTIVATRRARLKLRSWSNARLSQALDRMRPERRRTVAVTYDGRSRELIGFCSMHAWHIVRATDLVLEEHDSQLRRYADTVEQLHEAGALCVFGGDPNESRGRGEVDRLMRAVGMRRVMRHGVDGLWVTNDRSRVRLHSARAVSLLGWRGGEASHVALDVELRVRVDV